MAGPLGSDRARALAFMDSMSGPLTWPAPPLAARTRGREAPATSAAECGGGARARSATHGAPCLNSRTAAKATLIPTAETGREEWHNKVGLRSARIARSLARARARVTLARTRASIPSE